MLLIAPPTVAMAVTVNCFLAPAASTPNAHDTLEPAIVHAGSETAVGVKPGGNSSAAMTSTAAPGPALVKTIVKTIDSPTAATAGETLFVIDTSTGGRATVTAAVA